MMMTQRRSSAKYQVCGPNSDAPALVEIVAVIAGRADGRDLTESLAWALQNQAGLPTGWSRLNDRD